MMKRFKFSVLFSLLISGSCQAETDFEKGLYSYSQASFQEASDHFENALRQNPESDTILYNLGNSYFKQEKTAKAIYFYRRALRRNSSFEEARNNLTLARKEIASSFYGKDRTNELAAWLGRHKNYLLLASLILSLSSLCLFVSKTGLLLPAIIFIFACFAFISTLGLKTGRLGEVIAWEILKSKPVSGVVSEGGLAARSQPDSSSAAILKLLEGEEILADSLENGWARVQLPGNRLGWAKQDKIYFIDD